MRNVKLYTIKEEDVTVFTDYLEICNIGLEGVPVHLRNNDAHFVLTQDEVLRLNIQTIREWDVVKGAKESYVAVHPDVKKLICLEENSLRDSLKHTTTMYQLTRQERDTIQTLLTEQQLILSNLKCDMLKLTFWQRLLLAFKGYESTFKGTQTKGESDE